MTCLFRELFQEILIIIFIKYMFIWCYVFHDKYFCYNGAFSAVSVRTTTKKFLNQICTIWDQAHP